MFELLVLLWIIIGGVVGIIFYATEVLPGENQTKHLIAVAICGPAMWTMAAGILFFCGLKKWLEKE